MSAVTQSPAASAWAAAGLAAFPFLFFVSAPYGKLARDGWGAPVDGRLGWFLQELPSPLALVRALTVHRDDDDPSSSCGAGRWTTDDGAPSMALVAAALWCAHYANRAVRYPLTRRMSPTTLPVVLSAVAFNVVNGTVCGSELARRGCEAFGARNVPGLALMLLGVVINVTADEHLRALRAKKDGGGEGRRRERRDEPRLGKSGEHAMPAGGLFDRCVCPHYLGELLEWCGFAAMTGTAAACAFAFWTFANLFPRASTYREWYRIRFGAENGSRLPPRRAMIPSIASS
jgi:3-oxo-5-alpha-steroid 4-dehydrogenase 1